MRELITHPIVLSGVLAVFASACAFDSAPPARPQQVANSLPPMQVEEIGSSAVRRPITGDCGMESLQTYVGRPRTSVPRSVLGDNFRVLGPDSITTMEFRADRLTVRIDRQDRIESISCG